ncbi:5'-nucleotidase [Candidatus Collierbacteria bacterium]|nr:5'-nucleotidase [Candidatus Collierbacteria bacterium]
MERSTKTEIANVEGLVFSTRQKIERLLRSGKKVHMIWDFDGVLADSRSDDVFALAGYNLDAYFAHEERLILESPGQGPWLLPIAHNQDFWQDNFTQDVVTARSSALALRVHLFCMQWNLSTRWMLFLGHQPKNEAYRIILKSLKDDPDYHVFCIDDGAKHIEAFQKVCIEEGMEDRSYGIISPVTRKYSKEELGEYYSRVMGAIGNGPIRVRDSSDDTRGYIVLPRGSKQFAEQMNALVYSQNNQGHHAELRQAFVQAYGEVGKGFFKTEADLERAMNEFILNLHCP